MVKPHLQHCCFAICKDKKGKEENIAVLVDIAEVYILYCFTTFNHNIKLLDFLPYCLTISEIIRLNIVFQLNCRGPLPKFEFIDATVKGYFKKIEN